MRHDVNKQMVLREPCSETLRFEDDQALCECCDKQVHDLTNSTEAEIAAYVALFGADLCGRFRLDNNGEVLFRRKPQLRGAPLRWRASVALSLAACGGGGHVATSARSTPAVAIPQEAADRSTRPARPESAAMNEGKLTRPEIDQDGGGIPDYLDRCPALPGTVENDGCGQVYFGAVGISDRFAILEHVYFVRGAQLRERSLAVVDNVAKIVLSGALPDTQIIEVIGNAYDRERNRETIAMARAEAVRVALLSRGAPSSRVRVGKPRIVVARGRVQRHSARSVGFVVASLDAEKPAGSADPASECSSDS